MRFVYTTVTNVAGIKTVEGQIKHMKGKSIKNWKFRKWQAQYCVVLSLEIVVDASLHNMHIYY